MALGRKFTRGLSLARKSAVILWQDRSLMLLPILGMVALLAVSALFLAPIFASEELRSALDGDTPDTEFLDYAYAFAFYLVVFAIGTFFNVALMHVVLERLDGRPASIGDGLRLAVARLPQILGWAAVSATVGIALKILQDRAGALGRIVAGLAGFGWSVASYFVVPVLAREGLGPVQSVMRSAQILRKAWGESLAANFGLGLLVFAAVLVAALLSALAAAMLPQTAAVTALILVAVVFGAAVFVVQTLGVVLNAAIYDFAVTGEARGPFDRADLERAFVRREERG